MIPTYYEFQNSVKVVSGKNALENVPFELNNLNANKPIILTNEVLIKHGQVKILIDALSASNISIGPIFKDIPQDSSVEIVNTIAELYRQEKCDSIIAIGGGSVIDTAKGVNIVVSKGTDDLMNYMGLEIINGKLKPFIVIPSTAGTGSEATLVAVIANPNKNVKMEFISYNMLADVAVLDPRMTLSLPPRITASTGMDALSHSIEAYTCLQKNPLSDAYAFASIEIIRDNLFEAVQNGKNEMVRLAMVNASLMAGIAFSNSMVGIVHAIGHACGAISHVPHGDAMNILLPYSMEFNKKMTSEYYSKLLLPLAGPEIYSDTPEKQRAQKSIDTVKSMSQRLEQICGLPTRLRDVGVKKEDFDRIAKTAINDGASIVNPVEVTYDNVMMILDKAY
ncbi:iron-containing alcohol dehydrogenase [Brassicibacter mesophilus]|uniref:iron-containing alcohol dehydrogenase n=1 Tax=Brassicibacter mesophilus TaxID=745119 RepID=UPI003D2308F5